MSNESKDGFALWLTGLPASGKTSLAHALRLQLAERGIRVALLDSDRLRRILTPQPTYSDTERDWFYRVVVFLAELLTEHGVNVVIAATAPKRSHRRLARDRIERFAEVYLDCSEDVCRRRDPKGLWKRADEGEITRLPGVGDPYEVPEAAEARVDTAGLSPEGAALDVLAQLEKRGFF